MEANPAVAFLDLAPVGPDYLPADAHADTFSCELSLGANRLVVNCGTSVYEEGPRRQWEPGTAAHNTVVVDGEDSSEVWASFRVARRARITERSVGHADDRVLVVGSHDGYRRLPGEPVHHREWLFEPREMRIVDLVGGEGRHAVDIRLHVHPEWETARRDDGRALLAAGGGAGRCEVRFEGPGFLEVEENRWAPEFGRLEAIETLRYRVPPTVLPVEVVTRVSWGDAPKGAGT